MEKNRMILLFTDGIEILIDDEKIETWEQDENFVAVILKDGRKFRFDVLEKIFYEVSYVG